MEVCCSSCSQVIRRSEPLARTGMSMDSTTGWVGCRSPWSNATPAAKDTTLFVALNSISGTDGSPQSPIRSPRGMTTPLALAAARLGVKPQTLYAYVSRGLLESQSVPGSGRRARYRRLEVERLAARTGKGGRAGSLDVVIDTECPRRSRRAAALPRLGRPDAAVEASFERVAEWLWTGLDPGEPELWALPSIQARVRRVTAALPSGATPVDRLRAAALTLAAGDPMRSDRRGDLVPISTGVSAAPGRRVADDGGPGGRRARSASGHPVAGAGVRRHGTNAGIERAARRSAGRATSGVGLTRRIAEW